jgi:hypothetical protein
MGQTDSRGTKVEYTIEMRDITMMTVSIEWMIGSIESSSDMIAAQSMTSVVLTMMH